MRIKNGRPFQRSWHIYQEMHLVGYYLWLFSVPCTSKITFFILMYLLLNFVLVPDLMLCMVSCEIWHVLITFFIMDQAHVDNN